MNDAFRVARRYLAPPAQSFWKWSRDGEAIEWSNGKTIAFAGEVKHVLERLAPQGLPPLDAVVLLLAACRNTWTGESEEFVTQCHMLVSVEHTFLPAWYTSMINGLDHVSSLDSELRISLAAKAQLAEIVFEITPDRTLPTTAAHIVQMLEGRPPREMLACRAALVDADSLLKKLRCLQPGLSRVDADTLRLRARTGLEQEIAPAEAELWPAERMRLLLGQLSDDEELGGIVRLARNLMAAIHLPRPLADPDDLPAGGVSDISNRGNLDRLLISELAHDDLTLAVRVATNEALYLRRETPPKQPPRRRAVLIDSGIRMWGVPRVFATAVAMALTAKSDRGSEVDVCRATGSGLSVVDLTTRAGVVQHLEALSPDPHPATACKVFLEQAAKAGTLSDAVIVTSEDVLADREFRNELADCEASSYFLATVRRDGRFTLSMRTPAGTKSVCQATLDLDDVLAPRKKHTRPLIDQRVDTKLPLILGVDPFPLLLPHPLDAERAWHVEQHGVFAITRDRRLMLWKSKGQGARQLASDMPAGKILWAGSWPLGDSACAVVGIEGGSRLHPVEVNLETMESHVWRIDLAEPVRAVAVHNGVLFAIYDQKVETFAERKSTQGRILDLPDRTTWVHDRYFRGPGGWYALSADGIDPCLELAISSTDFRSHQPIAVFDVDGAEGPFGITAKGEILNTSDRSVRGPTHGLQPGIRVLGVSRNGHRSLLSGEPIRKAPGYSSRMVLYTLNARARPAFGQMREALESEIYEIAETRNLRHRFRGIYADGGSIVLVSRKETHLKFQPAYPTGDAPRLALTEPQNADVIPFENMPRVANTGYHLRVAKWSDGSRAFLDSRGLLHLKSAAESLPDITLVLHEGATAAWTSSGQLVGDDYFTGGETDTDPGLVDKLIYEFAQLLP